MSSENIYYYYTYLITHLIDNRKYIGSRRSKILPELDIGIKYFSSSSDKNFKKDQKNNPQNYRYEILGVFENAKDASDHENILHFENNVAFNPDYYNRFCGHSKSFNAANRVSVRDKDGKSFSVKTTDPRYLSGELVHVRTGLITAKNENGEIFSVSKKDPRYLSGELVGVTKGYNCDEKTRSKISESSKNHFTAKDKDGNIFRIHKTDPRYLSGELVHVCKGIKLSKEHCEKISVANKGKRLSEEHKQKVKDNHADCSGENNSFFGKSHSEETKKKIGNRDYSSQSGENHWSKNNKSPVLGSSWYNDGSKSYMLKPDDPKITKLNLVRGRNIRDC
jgi:hypothetical protein